MYKDAVKLERPAIRPVKELSKGQATHTVLPPGTPPYGWRQCEIMVRQSRYEVSVDGSGLGLVGRAKPNSW